MGWRWGGGWGDTTAAPRAYRSRACVSGSSSCHHGSDSWCVCVQLPPAQLFSASPSIARELVPARPVELWLVTAPSSESRAGDGDTEGESPRIAAVDGTTDGTMDGATDGMVGGATDGVVGAAPDSPSTSSQ
jgi:hypothetical protein